MPFRLLALDLEATLIDDALSELPRPGLNSFLSFCRDHFDRLALLTTVDEQTARLVLEALADGGDVPGIVADTIEYIDWDGEYKDLRNAIDVNVDEILFVDDDQGWIHPDQIEQWIRITPWRGEPDDVELRRVQQQIESRLVSSQRNRS